MSDIRIGRLPVPGATLHYEIRGSGPLPLLLQGGDGNTARGADLATRLATDYTVVAPDRRGLSGFRRPAARGPRMRADRGVGTRRVAGATPGTSRTMR